jgi:hypothetical protein
MDRSCGLGSANFRTRSEKHSLTRKKVGSSKGVDQDHIAKNVEELRFPSCEGEDNHSRYKMRDRCIRYMARLERQRDGRNLDKDLR